MGAPLGAAPSSTPKPPGNTPARSPTSRPRATGSPSTERHLQRELLELHAEEAARAANFAGARATYTQIQALHNRVRDELQLEMRKSA